jgi:hypothetical protein
LYVIGGTAGIGGLFSDVQYAQVNNDGTVGSWSTTTSLPANRSDHSALVYNNKLYILGHNGIEYKNQVIYTQINSDGTLDSSWQVANGPTLVQNTQSIFAYNGYIYTISGASTNENSRFIEYASINEDGTLSVWQNSGLSQNHRLDAAAVNYLGRIYYTGGTLAGTHQNTTYFSTVESIPRKATYSKLVDLGTARELSNINFNGTDGSEYTLEYKLACSTAFGSVTSVTGALSGQNYSFSEGARYVWFRLTIDESQSAVFPDTGASVSDIRIRYSTAHPSPDIRLRAGAFFEDNLEQPFDTNPEGDPGGGC